jgi:hypothetical protein
MKKFSVLIVVLALACLSQFSRTILVRDQRSEKILRKLTWNGEKFQEEK